MSKKIEGYYSHRGYVPIEVQATPTVVGYSSGYTASLKKSGKHVLFSFEGSVNNGNVNQIIFPIGFAPKEDIMITAYNPISKTYLPVWIIGAYLELEQTYNIKIENVGWETDEI